MTPLTLMWRNLGRNKLRTGLTVGSIAVSLFLVTMLNALGTSMREVAADSARQLRLVVHEKTTMIKLLPLGYGRQLAELPGVQAICAVRWFGGRLADSTEQFPSLAADRAALPAVYPDFGLSAAGLAAWRGDREAAIVGAGLAQRRGWTCGQRVVLRGGIPPYPALEFRIVAITHAQAYPNVFVFGLDYLLDAIRTDANLPPAYADAVNFYWVKAQSAAALEAARAEIDSTFAHATTRTRTELEEAFVANFTRMFGDIPGIVTSVGWLVVGMVLVVLANTMAMSIRERTGELALLKAIGYAPRQILGTLVGEATLLGACGAVLGCIPVLVLGVHTAGQGLNMPYFPVVQVGPAVVLPGIAAGCAAGLIAALPRAQAIARQPVTALLRGLE